jgi:glc operon protein GlcG
MSVENPFVWRGGFNAEPAHFIRWLDYASRRLYNTARSGAVHFKYSGAIMKALTFKSRIKSLLVGAAFAGIATSAVAQVPQYGTSINHEQARKVLGAAIAESRKMGLPMAVAVVDNAGQLVVFERMDNTQTGSIGVSQDKAVSAALYRRSTKAFQDVLAAGGAGLRVLTLRGANAVEGGLPLMVDGKIVGAIGVSGGSSEQDGVVAKLGSEALVAK